MSGQTLMSGMACLANKSLNKNKRQQIGLPQNMKCGLYLTLKANFLYFSKDLRNLLRLRVRIRKQ